MFSMRPRCPHAVGALSFAARRARVPLRAPAAFASDCGTIPLLICLVMCVPAAAAEQLS